jgi:hypothetical protein
MSEKPLDTFTRGVIEAGVSLFFLATMIYISRYPNERGQRLAARFRTLVNRWSGAETRDYLASPRAEFARKDRERMIEAEFAEAETADDCGCGPGA